MALVLGLGVAAGWTAPVGAVVAVELVSPRGDQPVFGQVMVEARVTAGEPVLRLEVWLDGRKVGVLTAPPWKLTVDAGQDNAEREWKVIVYGASGAAATARVLTFPLRIDEEMNVRLQQLYVTVHRGRERALDLGQGDFRILDNGVEQKIVTFGRGELPLTAVLLLDGSESMEGERLEAARRGAQAFVSGMKALDEAMLAVFSDHLLRITPFSEDKEVLNRGLADLHAGGGTAVNDFLYMALELLEARQGRRVVVLMSDGSDVHSVLPMAEVIRKARTSQALIYWIQLTEGEKHTSFTSAWRGHAANDREFDSLEKAVDESGGRIQKIGRISELEGAFRDILEELREQYALGYYPSALKGDGSWHQVKVRTPRSGVEVRTANGYLDF
ncbi:MAG: VWA domain-containing protein [Acidobacteriota bacterium]|nr:VWA domain-containing protein [Acidobacteriota bacterium]